jgi:hypothetical protein
MNMIAVDTLIDTIQLKAKSGNDIPVDRITLKKEEFDSVIFYLNYIKHFSNTLHVPMPDGTESK